MQATSHEGRQVYKLTPKVELTQRISTWFVNEPKFYGNIDVENEDILILIKDVAKQDPEFILKLAIYARDKLFLRTAPIVLLVEASLIDRCKPYVRQYTPQIVTRADQLTESISYLQHRIGHIGRNQDKGSMPASLKRGLADAIKGFNHYSLAKYNRDSSAKLRDVLKLTHPKPDTEEQSKLFKSLLDGTIAPPETWETIISTKGSTTENWQYASTKMGYMALLRNLSNFLKHNCNLDNILTKLTDKERIRKSRQYPFRFLSAYGIIQQEAHPQASSVLDALSTALDESIYNIPDVKGTTFVAIDHSPSMNDRVSEKSVVSRISVADTFASIINKRWSNTIIDVFSTEHKIANLSKIAPTLSNISILRNQVRSSGTNMGVSVQYLTDNKVKVDRIIYLTDEEGNGELDLNTELLRYRKEVNPDVNVFIMNLAGYGTSGVSDTDSKVCHFSGFSEKILDYISIFENGEDKQVKEIENYASNINNSG